MKEVGGINNVYECVVVRVRLLWFCCCLGIRRQDKVHSVSIAAHCSVSLGESALLLLHKARQERLQDWKLGRARDLTRLRSAQVT